MRSHAATPGATQAYPAKPLRMIVPFPAGASSDIVGRMLGEKLSEQLGQPVIADNRPGAGGNLGIALVAKSAPDGYTIVIATASIAVSPSLYAKLGFDPIEDLAPVARLTSSPNILIVHPSVPAKSVKELIALAKARPGQITLASAGTGGTLHLPIEMLMKSAGVNITHVPYKGAAPAVVDVVGGQVSGMFVDLPVISPYVKAGRVRALAMASPKRSVYFPEVPTTKEAGYANVELQNYYALFVPIKTPADIVAKLHDAVVKTVNTPAVREKLIGTAADPLTMTPEEFTRFVRADIEMWGRVVKASGIKIE